MRPAADSAARVLRASTAEFPASGSAVVVLPAHTSDPPDVLRVHPPQRAGVGEVGTALTLTARAEPWNVCFCKPHSLPAHLVGFPRAAVQWGIDGSVGDAHGRLLPPFEAPYSHCLDHPDYVLLTFSEAAGANFEHAHGGQIRSIFCKLSLYPLFREERMLLRDTDLMRGNMSRFTVAWNPDWTPYRFHGAEFSFSLNFFSPCRDTSGKLFPPPVLANAERDAHRAGRKGRLSAFTRAGKQDGDARLRREARPPRLRAAQTGARGAIMIDTDDTIINGNEAVTHGFEFMHDLYNEASLLFSHPRGHCAARRPARGRHAHALRARVLWTSTVCTCSPPTCTTSRHATSKPSNGRPFCRSAPSTAVWSRDLATGCGTSRISKASRPTSPTWTTATATSSWTRSSEARCRRNCPVRESNRPFHSFRTRTLR